jgi:hypothetical protein
MRTTVELPEEIYRRTERAAQERGVTVDALITDALEREFGVEPGRVPVRKRVKFPILESNQPGTLDLSDFNFDDLLT